MSEFKLYIDVPDDDVKIEVGADIHRIHFRDEWTVDKVIKVLEDLKIYAKYHDR